MSPGSVSKCVQIKPIVDSIIIVQMTVCVQLCFVLQNISWQWLIRMLKWQVFFLSCNGLLHLCSEFINKIVSTRMQFYKDLCMLINENIYILNSNTSKPKLIKPIQVAWIFYVNIDAVQKNTIKKQISGNYVKF